MQALILVDLQNDFMPGGALEVKNGFDILPVINTLLSHPFPVIVATKDWHPKDHGSFASNHNKEVGECITLDGLEQILWPEHCVQGTKGAEFAPGWDSHKIHKVIHKGTEKNVDSYSTFFDNGHRKSTGLFDFLKEKDVKDIFIAGLATDYCVKYSVLDAAKLGFNIYVVSDGCRGVNLKSNDSENALKEMRAAGAKIIKSKDISKYLK